MATPTRSQRNNPASGISMEMLVPGAFYQCITPGAFSDSLTGITIPGPRAKLDGSTKRVIVGLTDIPEPIQLPHFKMVSEFDETGMTRKDVLKDFTAADAQPVHEAFQLALATGIIRMVSEEEMEEQYPETWAARDEKLIWRHEDTQKAVPALQMFRDAQDDGQLLRITKNHLNIDQSKKEISRRQEQIDEQPETVPAVKKPPLPPPKK